MLDFSVYVRGRTESQVATFIAESAKAKVWTRAEIYGYVEGSGLVTFRLTGWSNITDQIEKLRDNFNFEVEVR